MNKSYRLTSRTCD